MPSSNSNFSGRTSTIFRISRWLITIPDGSVTATVTVPAVNWATAELAHLGQTGGAGIGSASAYLWPTNSTTVTATRSAGLGGGTLLVAIQITEYN